MPRTHGNVSRPRLRRDLRGDRRWRPRRWTVRATGDAAAIILRSPDNDEVIMLAGSQIVTSERLEVLALATTQRYPDGRPLARHASRACGGWSAGSDSMGLRQVVARARAVLDGSRGLERAALVFARRQRRSADGHAAAETVPQGRTAWLSRSSRHGLVSLCVTAAKGGELRLRARLVARR